METLFFQNTNNIRIDKYLIYKYPNLSKSILFKTFRKKDIKINGKWAPHNYLLKEGDKIDVYLPQHILNTSNKFGSLDIKYQDSNLIIVNKPQGLSVHSSNSDSISLDTIINEQIKSSSFKAQLCHRLDRNTGGLTILAKNQGSLDLILKQIKNGSIRKFYICYVEGILPKKRDILEAFLEKNAAKSKVFIHNTAKKNSKKITTIYNVLQSDKNISKLEIELKTGKTHQIRSHLAHIGYPIIGDSKYGLNTINKKYNQKYQALWAYKIIFSFPQNSLLHYLDGRIIQIKTHLNVQFRSDKSF